MQRRHLAIATATLVLLGSKVIAAQEPVIGFFGMAGRGSHVNDLVGLKKGLAELGYAPGKTIVIEEAYASGDTQQVNALVDQLLAKKAMLVIVPGLAAALAAHARAPDLPIIGVGLPSTIVEPELFASLQRPGGKVTGFSHFGEDLAAKRVELLREFLPSVSKIAILHNASDPLFRAWGEKTEAAARAQGLDAIRLELHSPSVAELVDVMAMLPPNHIDGMIVVRDFLTGTLLNNIIEISIEMNLPVMAEQRKWAVDGALMSYGANLPDLFRRAASYVDEILRGSDPAVMPIQLATEFELVINGHTAEYLGLAIPSALRLRADEVIE